MDVRPVYCPVCENKCSPQAQSCVHCGHRLRVNTESIIVRMGRWTFGTLAVVVFIAGFTNGDVASGVHLSGWMALLWGLTFVKSIF